VETGAEVQIGEELYICRPGPLAEVHRYGYRSPARLNEQSHFEYFAHRVKRTTFVREGYVQWFTRVQVERRRDAAVETAVSPTGAIRVRYRFTKTVPSAPTP
jgi:hypothetical protein